MPTKLRSNTCNHIESVTRVGCEWLVTGKDTDGRPTWCTFKTAIPETMTRILCECGHRCLLVWRKEHEYSK